MTGSGELVVISNCPLKTQLQVLLLYQPAPERRVPRGTARSRTNTAGDRTRTAGSGMKAELHGVREKRKAGHPQLRRRSGYPGRSAVFCRESEEIKAGVSAGRL